jgi:uncharacterized protein (DUF983 family)
MSSITCPRCGSQVPLRRFFNVASKPFCARCGWNLEAAKIALDAKSTIVKLILPGITGVILFVAFTASRADSPFIFIVPALFALVAITPLWGYYSARKALAAAKFTANPDLRQAQPPIPPSLQMLQSLPRPRRTRFSFAGNIAAVVIAFAAVGVLSAVAFVAISRRPLSHNNLDITALLPLLFVLPVFGFVVVIPFFREKRNLPLLRDGELAFARVTAQQTVQQGKTSYSRVDYEFKTNTGQMVRNSCRDVTSSIFEDMTIPVFYDALDPNKNIASCATYLKVVNSFE